MTWKCAEKPREKLLKRGAQALSDAELLAIFLRIGRPGMNVMQLAETILAEFGGLVPLLSADFEQFCQIKGLGPAKFVQLKACLEMSERFSQEKLSRGDALTQPDKVRNIITTRLTHRANEVFAALFLDNQHRVLHFSELFHGTINNAAVHPRVVVQQALKYNAAAIIVCHNHPSGVCEPSAADIAITRRLGEALSLIDVRLLDHFIVADGEAISMAERGLI